MGLTKKFRFVPHIAFSLSLFLTFCMSLSLSLWNRKQWRWCVLFRSAVMTWWTWVGCKALRYGARLSLWFKAVALWKFCEGNSFLKATFYLCLYQGKITAQGKLLQQDTFSVTEQDSSFLSRAKERRVFLFEQLVIFSEPIDRKKGFSLPGYTFKSSIKVRCTIKLLSYSLNSIRFYCLPLYETSSPNSVFLSSMYDKNTHT